MSEDLKKALDTALSRLASLEARLAEKPKSTGLDPAKLKQQLTVNPAGVFQQMGIPVEHVTRALVAHTMGDQAPPELRALASIGPQISATSELSSTVDQLRQQIEEMARESRKKEARAGFAALTKDASKYPMLSKALAADPALFDNEVAAHGGSVEDLAATLEARQAKLAAAYGVKATPPASEGTADTTAQSTQSQAQGAAPGGLDTTPPPIKQDKAGLWTEEEHRRLRDEIVRKYSSPKP